MRRLFIEMRAPMTLPMRLNAALLLPSLWLLSQEGVNQQYHSCTMDMNCSSRRGELWYQFQHILEHIEGCHRSKLELLEICNRTEISYSGNANFLTVHDLARKKSSNTLTLVKLETIFFSTREKLSLFSRQLEFIKIPHVIVIKFTCAMCFY